MTIDEDQMKMDIVLAKMLLLLLNVVYRVAREKGDQGDPGVITLITLLTYHIIITSQHQMFEVIFGPKSRPKTRIESFTPSTRKSPQK